MRAHRPSRRDEIIDAAIELFARKGVVDSSIADVAQEADVTVTAVYYHFSSKEELFTAAVERVFERITEVVLEARPAGAPGDEAALGAVTDAVWHWIDTHPAEAALVHLLLPGVTRRVVALRAEFEERHFQRAFSYVGSPPQKLAADERARAALALRTLIDLTISVHTMRLADGPLSGEDGDRLLEAVRAVCVGLVRAAMPTNGSAVGGSPVRVER